MRLKKFVLRNEVQDESGTEVLEVEQEVAEPVEEVAEEAPEESAESDEVVISIGDEPIEEAKEQAPEWVRELRKADREKSKRIRELEAKLQSVASPDSKPITLGKKPSLSDDGIDYDAELFEQRLTEWHDRKRQIEQQENELKRERDAQEQAWKDRLDVYAKSKESLKVKDYEDAEAVAQETLNVTQQGILVQGADNPALIIYALGKNPAKAKELAGIKDPVKFAFAIAKLETQLKVINRKAPPPPEKVIQGTGRASGAIDSTLERLRAEAEKTGDMSKVLAYKRNNRK
jgi:hypothetical protein